MQTGADALVEHLYRRGVRVIFGMPGSHSTAIYDAIVRHGGLRTILIRNEQAGAYAADGYARATGQPGVICTTAGPGATNALSGVAEAYADSVPVLLVTGQVNADRLHQECGAYHELDLDAIFKPCTHFTATVMKGAQVAATVEKAWRSMTIGRPRPAALILPQDIMAAEAGPQDDFALPDPQPEPIAETELQRAIDLLRQSRRPIILAGGGAVWSGAAAEVRELAERLGCPVVSTLNGKGIVDERHPNALGHARGVKAKAALPLADAMIAIGCRFTEVLTSFHTMPVPAKLIQMDIDPGQIGMNYPVPCGPCGDARTILRHLLDRLPIFKNNWDTALPEAKAKTHPQPEWLIHTLRDELPDDSVVCTDASEMALRMMGDFPAYAPRTFFYPSNYIALGWGFPAAVGAAVALPKRTVVSLSGDGGFTMTSQELATAARYNLNLVAIVHNDGAYGAIKNLQRLKHQARYLDTELNNPDFPLLARAYGIPGERCSTAESFRQSLRQALARGGPSLIEVPDQWRYLRV